MHGKIRSSDQEKKQEYGDRTSVTERAFHKQNSGLSLFQLPRHWRFASHGPLVTRQAETQDNIIFLCSALQGRESLSVNCILNVCPDTRNNLEAQAASSWLQYVTSSPLFLRNRPQMKSHPFHGQCFFACLEGSLTCPPKTEALTVGWPPPFITSPRNSVFLLIKP